MRILYVYQHITAHDHRFLSALSQTEHEVYALQLSPLETPSTFTMPTGVHLLLLTTETEHASLKKIITDINPDVIQAGPIHTVAAPIAALDLHPLVTASWGYDLLKDADQNAQYAALTRTVLAATDVLLCDCKASQQKALQFGFPENCIVTFPWGVDLQHFIPSHYSLVRQKLGWDNQFVILSTRAWEPLYGTEMIATTFVRLLEKYPHIRLLILNQGSQESLLRHILLPASLQGKVHFAGHIPLAELPAYYQAADLYVSASRVDGSSISLLEAMACGLPVCVSDIAGNREWIENEKQGWLFNNQVPDDCYQKLNRAIQKNNLFAMKIAVRNTVKQRADWKVNFKKLLDAYRLAQLICKEKI